VTAVDNGPLKKPIKSNPLVTHNKKDALNSSLQKDKYLTGYFAI